MLLHFVFYLVFQKAHTLFLQSQTCTYIIRIQNTRLRRNHPLRGTNCRSVICIKCYNPADFFSFISAFDQRKKSTSCKFRDLKSYSVVKDGSRRRGKKAQREIFTLMGLTYMADLCYCSFSFFFFFTFAFSSFHPFVFFFKFFKASV